MFTYFNVMLIKCINFIVFYKYLHKMDNIIKFKSFKMPINYITFFNHKMVIK